ncbi:hypothetical protein [Lysinibacter sp. HNR]|uniref:hypothetical protein n=1 Tax=Lysinibacter sp. HNR TaxID=3031408 RepID=UPI002435DC04|nr:hypothetical protein [Lysinibacter sp. HNR]WGD38067.1 hypothetical protein FrondiHNR_03885 [Lysinibacter sp. HNR]
MNFLTSKNRKKSISLLLFGALFTTGLITGVTPTQPASALSGSQFDPGNIISDTLFYNSQAMSQAQIQNFLDAKVGSCLNGNCLNVKRTNTTTRDANPMCNAYRGAPNELTSEIIYKVQSSCGISAKVLLVTLEKEQSLVTHRNPTDARLDRAMGYACPDNPAKPGWCDPTVGGLYNQLYMAAWQFKRYGNPPGTTNTFTWYPVGRASNVLYNPNAACGSKPVTIKNKATAALYYYTPYQPNAAALNNLYGAGDSCSAYGNRNFWRLYNDWFGSTQGAVNDPIGQIVSTTTPPNRIYTYGWAFDPDSPTAPLNIHFLVNNTTWYAAVANEYLPATGALYPEAGNNHGYSISIPATKGPNTICTYAKNIGPGNDTNLGCQTVEVPDTSPIGQIVSTTTPPNRIYTYGWAFDPDSPTAPLNIHFLVNNTTWYAAVANEYLPATGALYPEAGNNHGYSISIPATKGPNTICTYAKNIGPGNDTNLGCQTVEVPDSSPVGKLSAVTPQPGAIRFTGWAVSPDNFSQNTNIHILIGTTWASTVANKPNPDSEASLPGSGSNRGFDITAAASPGQHRVCVYAKNIGVGNDTNLGCQTVEVPDTSPIGQIVSTTTPPNRIYTYGWAFDPDSPTAPLNIHFLVNNTTWYAAVANEYLPATGALYPEAGNNHGYSISIPATKGPNTICTYAKNIGPGNDTNLGCQTVTVP